MIDNILRNMDLEEVRGQVWMMLVLRSGSPWVYERQMMLTNYRTYFDHWSTLYHVQLSGRDIFRSLERLSSGLAINRAADGPAQLVISEQLRSQVAALSQQIDNLSMTVKKYEYASSTIGQLRSQLTEIRSLAVGAANEGFNDEHIQAAYDNAAQSLVSSYNDLVQHAEYNGRRLFDGSEGSVAETDTLAGIDLSSAEAANESLAAIDEAMRTLDHAQVEIGATQTNDLEAQQASLAVTRENLMEAERRLRDTDFAAEYANLMGAIIIRNASLALLAHSLLSAEGVIELFGS